MSGGTVVRHRYVERRRSGSHQAHAERDAVNHVHGGVVRAVADAFDAYEIDRNIWWLRKTSRMSLRVPPKARDVRATAPAASENRLCATR